MLPIDPSHASQAVKDSVLDANSLNSIKTMGRNQDPQALKEIAKKFEAIFVQQMLKSMRAANDVFAQDSYFNSSEMQFHRDMYDQQMSLELTSGQGIGLADALYAQMARAYGQHVDADQPATTPTDIQALPQAVNYRPAVMGAADLMSKSTAVTNPFSSNRLTQHSQTTQLPRGGLAAGGKTAVAQTPAEFVAALRPYAEKAAAELNVDADVLLAQAALETGWGRHVIHTQRGENSFNLFNIKAGTAWRGAKVNVSTLEYAQGVARQERADFRRYNNYAESFADYVDFLQSNPRYQRALSLGGNSAAYAEELQRAGYATDPAYAQKIKAILASEPIREAAQTLVAMAADTNER